MRAMPAIRVWLVAMLLASTGNLFAGSQILLPAAKSGDSFHSEVFTGLTPEQWQSVQASREHVFALSGLPRDDAAGTTPASSFSVTQFFGTAGALIALVLVIGLSVHEHRKRRFAEAAAHQRMSELALINRQATAGEMSAAIAHEINQPLGIILNNAEAAELILDSKTPDLLELKELLADIRRSDHRASDIIKHLRALLSHTMTKFAPIDLNLVAQEAIEIAGIQAHARGVALHVALTPGSLPVVGDSIQLQQVFINVILNGIDAVGGRMPAYRDIVISTSLAKGDFAEVSVSDSGPGIAEENFERVFEPFFSTKQNGMGVGLSLCRTIIQSHSGSIWASNGIAGGAIFHFRLPLANRSTA
jgi:C4-dicarboxylate-specific signal transduction histidine kinase